MKHVKLLFALIVVLLAGLAAGEMAMAQGKKKSTSKIPVKTEKPAAKRTTQPKQEKKPAAKPRQEKKREADEAPRKVVERKPQSKPEPKPEPKAEPALSNRTFTANGVSFTMVAVQGGTFTMGATSEQGSDADSDERPKHNVTLSSYHIGETEVTQALWEAVMGSNPSRFKGSNRPVERVSWKDCQEFIKKLNKLTGKQFRLPTEAEWEYAARGGHSGGYKYSGSDIIYDVAWFDMNSSDKGSSSPDYGTHPVASKRANELGIYDMSGNVWEWCSDWWYGAYSSSSQSNPTGPSSGSLRVFRGGGWSYRAGNCRVSRRNSSSPDYRSSDLGLRLAL